MNRIGNRELPLWLAKMTATIGRCHLLGAMGTTAVLLLTVWVWSWNFRVTEQVANGESNVNLQDAIRLIENADRLRQEYTATYHRSQRIDEQIQQIQSWLPKQLDWSTTETRVRQEAESRGLVVRNLRMQKKHVGSRVGIVAASLEVAGTYDSVCSLLAQFSEGEFPIACSELNLVRTQSSTSAANIIATIALRIPFASQGSTAGKLIKPEGSHAS